jgi:hypothetical protein
METKPREKPKSLGRYLMESKRQTQEEMQERYRTDPEFRAIFERLKEKNAKRA